MLNPVVQVTMKFQIELYSLPSQSPLTCLLWDWG
ncbi:hypothetical protein LEMLEM_LOCUS11220 [Lemmus lemmus]